MVQIVEGVRVGIIQLSASRGSVCLHPDFQILEKIYLNMLYHHSRLQSLR